MIPEWVDRPAQGDVAAELRAAGRWSELHDTLADLGFLHALWQEDQYEARRAWAALQAATDHRMPVTYAAALEEAQAALVPGAARPWCPGRLVRLRTLAALLVPFGHHRAAHSVRAFLLEQRRAHGDPQELADALGDLAETSAIDQMLELSIEQERLCEQLGDAHGLQSALGRQATAYWLRSLTSDSAADEKTAHAALKRRRKTCRNSGDLQGLQDWMFWLACMIEGNDPETAQRLCTQRESLCRHISELDGLHSTLRHRATILTMLPTSGDKLAAALPLLDEAEVICRDLGHACGLLDALCTKGIIRVLLGDAAAAPLFDEAHAIGGSLSPPLGLAERLGNAADWRLLRPKEALLLYQALQDAAERLGDPYARQRAHGGQARLELDGGHPVTALELFREQEAICRQLEQPRARRGLRESYRGQVGALRKRAQRRFDDEQTLAELSRLEKELRLLEDSEGAGEAAAAMAMLCKRQPVVVPPKSHPQTNLDQLALPGFGLTTPADPLRSRRTPRSCFPP